MMRRFLLRRNSGLIVKPDFTNIPTTKKLGYVLVNNKDTPIIASLRCVYLPLFETEASMRTLYVVHAPFWREFTGTPLIARQYCEQAIKYGFTAGLLIPRKLVNYSPTIENVTILSWESSANWSFKDLQDEYSEQDAQAIRDFNPSVVHILDLVNFKSTLLPFLKTLNRPLVRHIWNFEDYCHFIEPIRFHPSWQVCSTPVSPDTCSMCVTNNLHVTMKSVEWKFGDLRREVKNLENFFNNHREQVERELIQKWAFFKENIESFKAIIFPSKSFLDYFKRQIDIPEERCRLVAHGVNVNQPAKLRDYSHNRPVNLIFVAGGSPERKGWQIVKGALEKLSQTHNSRFRVRVYAQMNDRFKSESGLGNLKNIEFLPAFPPDNLSDVLQWADVGLLPTSFETYCRLIREFILSGVIPITTSAFGIEEVITNNKNGIIIERLKDDNLYQEIIRLLDSPETMATLGKNLQTTIVESPADEFKALVKIYDSIH